MIKSLAEQHGEKNKRLSSKYYQKASSLLNMRRREEAIDAIQLAIDIFENPTPEVEVEGEEPKEQAPQKQLDFNRIQYQNFLCSVLFI